METLRKILVVEDDASIRRLAKRMLRSMEVEVLEAGDGEVAKGVFEEEKSVVGAVMIDMRLPDIQGDELADWIRERAPELPLIFFSGKHLNERAKGRLQEEHTYFLSKPFSKESIRDVMEKVFAMA